MRTSPQPQSRGDDRDICPLAAAWLHDCWKSREISVRPVKPEVMRPSPSGSPNSASAIEAHQRIENEYDRTFDHSGPQRAVWGESGPIDL